MLSRYPGLKEITAEKLHDKDPTMVLSTDLDDETSHTVDLVAGNTEGSEWHAA